MPIETRIAIGINFDIDTLTNLNVVNSALVDIGGHGYCIEVRHCNDGQTGSNALALYCWHLNNSAVHGAGNIDCSPAASFATSTCSGCTGNGSDGLARGHCVTQFHVEGCQRSRCGSTNVDDLGS